MATPQENFQPVYQGRDFYVPAFDIKIKGESLPDFASKDVIEVRYIDSIDQLDSFVITVNNWDAKEQDFKYTGSKNGKLAETAAKRNELFDPGKELELWMGYLEPVKNSGPSLRLMLAGTITEMTPNFPSGGQPTLKVSGQNVLRKLITKQETHIYEKLTDSDIAKKIGQRGNLKIGNLKVSVKTNPTEEEKNDHVLQNNQYDILFLIQRARMNGYDVLLRQVGDPKKPELELYFGPSINGSKVSYKLEWGKSLIQFQPTLTTAKQVYSLTVHGWDSLKKKRIEVTVNLGDLKKRGLKDKEKLKTIEEGFKERKEIIVDRPFRNLQEAKRYALDRLERLSQELVTGRGSTIGMPAIRSGSMIEIQGLGSTFEGNYFIKSTTHTISTGGYITEFEARLEEKNE